MTLRIVLVVHRLGGKEGLMNFGRGTITDYLQHVVQCRSNDCVIATAAMIANVSYDTAAQRSPVPVGERGLYSSEILRILESVTGISWSGPQFALWHPIYRLKITNGPFVVVIRRPWKWNTLHCLAISNGCVHDPEYRCRQSMDEYPRRRWRVVAIYRPVVAERLMAVREYHRRQQSELLAVLRRRAQCCT